MKICVVAAVIVLREEGLLMLKEKLSFVGLRITKKMNIKEIKMMNEVVGVNKVDFLDLRGRRLTMKLIFWIFFVFKLIN